MTAAVPPEGDRGAGENAVKGQHHGCVREGKRAETRYTSPVGPSGNPEAKLKIGMWLERVRLDGDEPWPASGPWRWRRFEYWVQSEPAVLKTGEKRCVGEDAGHWSHQLFEPLPDPMGEIRPGRFDNRGDRHPEIVVDRLTGQDRETLEVRRDIAIEADEDGIRSWPLFRSALHRIWPAWPW